MSERNLVEVYRAKDSPQAHMLKSALEDAGIQAVIDGDLLQGALGEIPVGWAGAPRILVDSRDVPRARAIIGRGERAGAVAPAGEGDDVGACLACGARMRVEDEACPACGWSYKSGGAEGGLA